MDGAELYKTLLAEAKQSPNLLEDLAALEGYLAETYSSRAFIELLQNADDAGATIVEFSFDGERLFCSNNGKPLSDKDVQGLCRSGKSSKSRGSSIGYRGVGFKSTASLASQILVSSGDYCFKFSKELTAKALSSEKAMPLIRLPHFGKDIKSEWDEMVLSQPSLAEQSTNFVFDVLSLSALEAEFENFRADYLLFLKNVLQVRMSFRQVVRTFYREETALTTSKSKVKLSSTELGATDWLVLDQGDFSIACATAGGSPTPLRQDSSLFHSFLPTNETTGLGVRINADFSTDPSRTKITMDDKTLEILKEVSVFVAKSLMSVGLGKDDEIGLALTPESVHFGFVQSSKSVKAVLLDLVKSQLKDFAGFSNLRTKPSWAQSVELVLKSASLDSSPKLVKYQNEDQLSFFRSVGIKPLIPAELLSHYETTSLSRDNRVSLIAQLLGMSAVASPQDVSLMASSPIWETVAGEVSTLPKMVEKLEQLSPSFLGALEQNGVSVKSLSGLLQRANPDFKGLIGVELENSRTESQSPESWTAPENSQESVFFVPQDALGLDEPMWRTAELFVLKKLRDAGFEANDVSRQFVGYDINAKLNGVEYFVEVKKVSSFSEPISLTSNEQAFANHTGSNFVIAVVSVSASGHASTLAFISNPVAKLQFERQCQKWVWECSTYRDHLRDSIS